VSFCEDGELGEDCGEAGDGCLAETACGWWPFLWAVSWKSEN
jgi:hypothetical protein